MIFRPLNVSVLRLTLCSLHVGDVMSKEEDNTTLVKTYQTCPINFVLRAGLPMM